jgi:hypothetical protein
MKPLQSLASGILPACLAVGLAAKPALAQAPAAAPPAAPADPAAAALVPSAPAEYDLPPPGARWDLLLTGVAVTGVSYGLALGASYAWPSARTADELRLPIIGPWMAIADTGCTKDDPDCSTVLLVVTAIVTGVDGVLQAGGIGVAIESAFLPTSSGKSRPRAPRSASPSVRPVPILAGKDGIGLGVVGTF